MLLLRSAVRSSKSRYGKCKVVHILCIYVASGFVSICIELWQIENVKRRGDVYGMERMRNALTFALVYGNSNRGWIQNIAINIVYFYIF